MHTKRIVRLWERMTALYGSRWAFEYGPAVESLSGGLAPIAAIWADALADADNSAIVAGLRKCLDRDRDNPPTLPEFLRLCGARTGTQIGDTRADQPCLPPYADTPRTRMERLAAELAEEASDVGADDSRAYWMTKIGTTPVGKSLVKSWKGAA